jgi:hypothetical protein
VELIGNLYGSPRVFPASNTDRIKSCLRAISTSDKPFIYGQLAGVPI